MGKRKAKAKPPPKKAKTTLPSQFDCLFCNHEKSVSVTMDKKAGTGELSCKVCGQQYQTNINSLSDAVDVFSDWVDACDEVAKEAAGVPQEEDYGLGDTPPTRKAAAGHTEVLSDDGIVGNAEDDYDDE